MTTHARHLLAALTFAAVAACSDDSVTPPEDDPTAEGGWESCQASDAAFARRAIFAVLGRSPRSQAEVAAVAATYSAAADAHGPAEGKRRLVNLLSSSPEYVDRWADVVMDAFRVPRILDTLSDRYGRSRDVGCYTITSQVGVDLRSDNGELARYVRDHSPSSSSPPLASFRMAELLRSSLRLDDVSPMFRANVFHLMNFALTGANVTPEELETTRRLDFGRTFFQTYLNRDLTCLPCHNSEASVTSSPVPEENRTWAIAGLFERALFTTSYGDAFSPLEYTSMFRVDGVFTRANGELPWGWDRGCGQFNLPTTDDPLGVETRFGSIGPTPSNPLAGKRGSVWSLEASLALGLEALRGRTMVPAADGTVDPDQALAYLTALAFVERVWTEIIGTDLTIATKFARAEIQRDVLKSLADAFTSSGYSLKALVAAIVAHPAFNLAAPASECWESPYAMPRLFNPWTNAEEDEAARLNGPGDRVHFRNPRTQTRILTSTLGWPALASFPEAEEKDFQVTIGVFNSPADPGFRGADFEGRLAWEDAFATCDAGASSDYVTRLAARTQEVGGTGREALEALWSRLIGAPSFDDGSMAALASSAGLDLDAAAPADVEQKLRAACGALLSSPQFLLEGLALDEEPVPSRLDLPEDGVGVVCDELRQRAPEAELDPDLVCSGLEP